MARGSTFAATALTLGLAVALPQSTSKTSGKRGIPYNNATQANLFVPYDEITWGYNWNVERFGLDSKFEYIPMLYSDPTGNQQYIDNWHNGVQDAIASGTKHIVAFNEPDINNISPSQAATSWRTFVEPYAGQLLLGAPAVTNGGSPDGLTWLNEFLSDCSNCTINFVPFHWYCAYDNIEYFTSYVEQFYAAVNRPLWLTEFQGDNEYCDAPANGSQQIHFLKTVLPWLDATSYMQRYSYFGAFESSSTQTYMLNANGSALTKSGKVFATYNKVNATTPNTLV